MYPTGTDVDRFQFPVHPGYLDVYISPYVFGRAGNPPDSLSIARFPVRRCFWKYTTPHTLLKDPSIAHIMRSTLFALVAFAAALVEAKRLSGDDFTNLQDPNPLRSIVQIDASGLITKNGIQFIADGAIDALGLVLVFLADRLQIYHSPLIPIARTVKRASALKLTLRRTVLT